MLSKIHLLLIPLSFLFLQFGTAQNTISLIPTFNEGGYTLKVNESKKSEEVYIYGKVVDVLSKEPLSHTELTIGCDKVQTLADGKYSFKIKSSNVTNTYFVEAISIGYKTIETAFFPLNKDSINIDFYLAEDDRPFINCEGINYTDFNE